ncbi:MAG: hypothetical protein MOB07_08110 [Acidobacteria bacterium]|nr:hypothetical protein [Acidobacteriota bacterium]
MSKDIVSVGDIGSLIIVALVVFDQVVADRLIHKSALSLQLFARALRLVFQHTPDPFLVNLIGPARAVQPSLAERQDQVRHRN